MRDREELKKKRIRIMQLLSIRGRRIRWSLRNNRRHKGSERRRSVKFKDLESFKKRLLIDRLKLMLYEPRGHSKRESDKLEKEKDSNKLREKESKLISKKPDKSNSKRRHQHLQNRLELKEKTTCIKFRSKNKLSSKRGRLKKIENKPSLIIHIKSGDRLMPTRILRSKIDSTI